MKEQVLKHIVVPAKVLCNLWTSLQYMQHFEYTENFDIIVSTLPKHGERHIENKGQDRWTCWKPGVSAVK